MKIGDRVKVNKPALQCDGKAGTIIGKEDTNEKFRRWIVKMDYSPDNHYFFEDGLIRIGGEMDETVLDWLESWK
jgi:hypothetical protein